MPARNRFDMDCSAIPPQMMRAMDGGINGARMPALTARDVAYALEYPRSAMAGIMTEPIAAVVAGADPEIEANMVAATIVTCPMPPIRWRTSTSATAT